MLEMTFRILGSIALGPLEVKAAMKGEGLVPIKVVAGIKVAVGDGSVAM